MAAAMPRARANAREAPVALKDKIKLGMSLPHRSTEPLDQATVRAVAQRS